MAGLKARLANLEQLLDEPAGPTWTEMVAATHRLGQHARRELNAHFFGLPGSTSAENEQAAQARAVVATWDRRHGTEPEPLSPMDRARIARAIEERVRLGEPWPTG